ncbi:mitochondrial serine protease (Peptidase S28 domain-containing protein) [Andalucia godoyi]|uniref:Mitochondrial serine protease (Peptidase S28 domain-containing protein) n=1 Tax=Andalucia godoyi TaxID=505711 RepID=A0A8K0AIQ8_ANDGO|nr:mitochondrial serine protease (Peptidase S28 domain-containing protein) [Andalucia godoyi]|eukprot:ANDGO_03412.mRNA.1 mitochondrial serine protease (Peptidase S28 domain-containing protein)
MATLSREHASRAICCRAFLLFIVVRCASAKLTTWGELSRITAAANGQKEIATSEGSPYETAYFTQQLNHFDPLDTRTFQQQYFVVSEYSLPNGPLFIHIGGESTNSASFLTAPQSFLNVYAKKYGALLLSPEHRYYGNSVPFFTVTVENWQYLSADQAIEDLASFTVAMKSIYGISGDRKVILIGCSYPGTLSAMARAKYPFLFDGAVAMSCPLEAKNNFFEYADRAVASLARFTYGSVVDNCAVAIQKVSVYMQGLVDSGLPGLQQLFQNFSACENPADFAGDPFDTFLAISNLARYYVGFVQYNIPGREELSSFCSSILNVPSAADPSAPTPFEYYVQFFELYVQMMSQNSQQCISVFQSYETLAPYYNSTVTLPSDVANTFSWLWQKATTFGFMKTSGSPANYLYPSILANAEMFAKRSAYAWHFPSFASGANTAATNVRFGDRKLSNLNSVLIIGGKYDPWQSLSVSSSFNNCTQVAIYDRYGHCAMYSVDARNPSEYPEMVSVFSAFDAFIAQVIQYGALSCLSNVPSPCPVVTGQCMQNSDNDKVGLTSFIIVAVSLSVAVVIAAAAAAYFAVKSARRPVRRTTTNVFRVSEQQPLITSGNM